MKQLIAFVLGLFALAGEASAFDLNPNEIRGKSSKEPVTVLQNRYFTKSYRPEFGLMAGQILDEAYLNTQFVGVRAGMFVSEWLGFEVQQAKTTVADSDDRRALNKMKYRPLEENTGNALPDGTTEETIVHPDPEVNAIHSMTDITASAAPFYGKLNFLNKWIVYTDLYLTAGMARIETDQGDKSAIIIGGGERLYVGQSWSFRIDFKDRIFNETRAGEPNRKNSYSVDLGASYFFN